MTSTSYPYGLPHALISSEVAGAEVNRRKFGGKELMSDHGYNSYDFVARHQNPAFPHFTTPDPLAEKFKHLSPHLFCAGDPINNIDPTGMKWENNKEKENLLMVLDKRLKKLNKQVAKITTKRNKNISKNKSTKKQDKKLQDLNSQISFINQAISDVNTLENDSKNTYKLMQVNSGDAHKVKKIGDVVYIQYSLVALIFHEIAHIRQNLEHRGKLEFSSSNEMISTKSTPQGLTKNELNSYRIQYSVNNNSLPISVGNINQINIEYLTRIWTKGNRPAYEFAHKYVEILKATYNDKNDWINIF